MACSRGLTQMCVNVRQKLGKDSGSGSQRGPHTLDGVALSYISSSFITHTLACCYSPPTASHLEHTRENGV